jgi:integrase/recombinase XerD
MMRPYRRPPVQKALPLEQWPMADREGWLAAQIDAGPLEDGGLASHLAPRTRDDLTKRYAYYLDFLATRGRLEHDRPAAACVTDDNIMDYVRFLEPRLSSVTLAQSIYKIARVASCLAPERDWRWLRRVCRRLDIRATPRDKRNEVVEIKELRDLGLQLMERAENAEDASTFARMLFYRDGLIIALLATDPVRCGNFTSLELGKTLIQDVTTWSLDIPARETKNRRDHLAILPDWICPHIDRYVEHFRPLFRNSEPTSQLWLNRYGQPLDAGGLARAVCRRTLGAFGKRINPHLFRDCLATSTAVHHGARMGLAMTILGHQSSVVTQKYYNQADMIGAVRAYQDIVLGEPQDEEKVT